MTVAPAPRFEPHNRVAGKFRLRRRLATGGMGEVWVARNESTGADVALKVLRRGDADREEELQTEERFRHEARLSAVLSHRSIVKVFDLMEEADGTLVLVMELLRGETLQAYVERKGPRPAREAVAVLSPILSALAHAHDRGIIHRDVTPANIFLAVDPDGHVTPKLVDFGIAKLSTGGTPSPSQVQPVKTLDGRVLGTPRYMAPERIRGSNDIDGRVDVFAAAVVLYETMTGLSPFAASTPSASLAAVLERHIDPDPRIEPRLWVEIQRALSKRPYERHATAQELATALRAAVGETEGALEASLRRTQPPRGWDDGDTEGGAELPAREPPMAGQSVIVLPRKRLSSLVWLTAAAAIGALAALLVFGLRGIAAPGESANRTASSYPTATATAIATATATATNTGSPVTPWTALPSASIAPPTSPARPSPRPVVRPRPVATTPGF